MWMIAASFRRTHSPSRLAWSEDWAAVDGRTDGLTELTNKLKTENKIIIITRFYHATTLQLCAFARHSASYLPDL